MARSYVTCRLSQSVRQGSCSNQRHPMERHPLLSALRAEPVDSNPTALGSPLPIDSSTESWVTIPEGTRAGDRLTVFVGGASRTITVPAGLHAGDVIVPQLPPTAAALLGQPPQLPNPPANAQAQRAHPHIRAPREPPAIDQPKGLKAAALPSFDAWPS